MLLRLGRAARNAALAACLLPLAAAGQTPPSATFVRQPLASFPTVGALRDTLRTLAADADAARRAHRLDGLFGRLRAAGQVPFAAGDSVLWLFRGPATSVAWAGDMTGWSPTAAGERLGTSDVWLRASRYPADARLDYKVVVNGSDWRLDPANALVQWSGFGPNSELRMPAFAFRAETVRRADVPAGTLGPERTLVAPGLGYPIAYRVYTPPGYDRLQGLPVLYVTDGHEYAPDALGALVTTLDNGIAAGRVAPLVAVFVDPRNPANRGHNRREQEFLPADASRPGRAADFLAFLTDVLAPEIERTERVRSGPDGRGLLGTSFGGVFTAFAATERPGSFTRLGINSPAFWVWPAVYARFDRPPAPGTRVYLSQGTISDGDGGTRLKPVLERNGYALTYAVRNEGHSWGQWRGLVPDLLAALYPAAEATGAAPAPRPSPGALRVGVAPNPTRALARLQVALPAAGESGLRVYDGAGRVVATPWPAARRRSGVHTVPLDVRGWAAGRYVARLTAGSDTASAVLTVVR